jgi:uncharacterized protein YbaR (Trm112 family)
MVEKIERRVACSELNRMVLVCPACKTEITIDASSETQCKNMESRDWKVPCPMCRTSLDSNLVSSLYHFSKWYSEVKASGQGVFFRIEVS